MRTRIDSERYTGWTRLGTGRRKRRTTASVAEVSRWVPRGGGHASAWRAMTTTGDLTTVRPMPPPVALRSWWVFLCRHWAGAWAVSP